MVTKETETPPGSIASSSTRRPFSVAWPKGHWYVACTTRELRRRPLGRVVMDTPLCLFRSNDGAIAALLDRCAHRNVPLSLGRRVETGVECAYHGWQFDRSGRCRLVPGLCGPSEGKGRHVPAFPAVEQQGLVWVFLGGANPVEPPPRFPGVDEPGYRTYRFSWHVTATLHATLENMLDVLHTSFLHRGLFRGGERHRITAVVRRFADRVEAEYQGEPPPRGLAARLLTGGRQGTLEHFDRFFLPSTSQVEYRLGDRSHLIATAPLTPVSSFETVSHLLLALRLPFPVALIRPVLEPVLRWILGQDAKILRAQTDSIRRFGGEQYVSTELDLLGPEIWRLLRQADEGVRATADVPAVEKRVTLLA